MKLMKVKPPSFIKTIGGTPRESKDTPSGIDTYHEDDIRPPISTEHITEHIDYDYGITARVLPPTHFPQRENAWHGTNPANHDPSRFRYLIHAVRIRCSEAKLIQLKGILEEEAGSYDATEDFDLVRRPSDIAQKSLISCSLIDAEHTTTFSNGGFILEVSNDHVLDVSNTDMGTAFITSPKDIREQLLAKRQSGYLPPDPESVLSATNSADYNEALITGTINDHPVKIIGIFIKKNAQGDVIDRGLEIQLKELASTHDWPIVYISMPPKPSYQGDSEIYLKRGELLAFNIGERRYAFGLTDTGHDFDVYEDGGDSQHKMTSDELHFALSYLNRIIKTSGEALIDRISLPPCSGDECNKLGVLTEIIESISNLAK